MNMTPMERKGWWLQTDCHMEFEPADPDAFGWVSRRMKGFVSLKRGGWVAYKVHGDEFDVLGRFGDRDRAMARVEREYAQQEMALSTDNRSTNAIL